jgi:hypothetical protein
MFGKSRCSKEGKIPEVIPREDVLEKSAQVVFNRASVLHSKRAVHVNIEIMRAFVRLRRILTAHKDLERNLAALEKKYDEQFMVVFEAIRQLMTPPETERKKIGFEAKEAAAPYGKGKSGGSRKQVCDGNL